MKEQTLLKIAIVTALLGMFSLYLLSDAINIDESSISKIEQEEPGKSVKILGTIEDLYQGETSSVLTIKRPEDVTVFVYRNKQPNMTLAIGDQVEIIGKIDEFNNQQQVQANRIRKLE